MKVHVDQYAKKLSQSIQLLHLTILKSERIA